MVNTTQSHNKQLERNFQKLEESISANNEQIQLQFSLLKDSVSALQSAVSRNNEQLDSIGNEQNSMSSRLRKLEEEVERQERYLRRSNVLLYGMKEEAGESLDRCTARVIKTLRRHFPQKDWNETDVERAHRLGPLSRKSDRPRPVIIKFQRWRDAMIIMRDKEGKNLMRDSDGLRVGADKTTKGHFVTAQEPRKACILCKGEAGSAGISSTPQPLQQPQYPRPEPHQTCPPPLPPMQSSPARTAEQRPMQRQQQRPQEPVTEPVRRWTAGPSRWRMPPWRKTPLMTSLQLRSVRCLPTGALQWGTGQSLPFPDHLPALPLAWITHQGHVALIEAPPLAPRSRTPSAEVEAVVGGAEEDPAVQTCRPEGTRDASPSPRRC